MNKIELISTYLDSLFENPRCELDYKKDYELLIAVVLSAQTTDKAVNNVSPRLFKTYSSLESLAKADVDKISDIIKSIGAFRKKAVFIKEIASKLVELGHVPNDRAFLESLPGVGRKTANVVLSNLHEVPAIAVDTHVARVSKRLGLAYDKDDVDTIEKRLMKKFPQDRWIRLHHQLVLFGRYKCKAQKPECESCQLKEICKYYKKSSS